MAAKKISKYVGTVIPMVFHINGPLTASVTGILKFKMPAKGAIVRAAASAKAASGDSTLSVDVQDGGTSILDAVIDLNAVADETYVEGDLKLANANDVGVLVAADAVIEVDVAITGIGAQTVSNITVQLDFVALD